MSRIRNVVVVLGVMVGMFSGVEKLNAQPPPGLTLCQVVAVASPQYRGGLYWDFVPGGAVATPNDHGGAWLEVVVYEQGCAIGEYSAFNGTTMTLYYSQPLVNANSQIYGHYRYYRIQQQFTSGLFFSSANSIGFPFGTKSTALNIR